MAKLTSRKIAQNSTILFNALGCKLNKYEIEVMRSQAEGLGLSVLFNQKNADVIVVNTCSVTNQASKDSRRMIRKYRNSNPESYIVATGCYAQTDSEEVKELGVDLLLSNLDKEKFFSHIANDIEDFDGKVNQSSSIIDNVQFQSRPFLKVQDGCNAFCSYCIIPRARGRSRSTSVDDVISQVKELAPSYPELVLSGVNLGQYESDGVGFFELLQKICAVDELQLLRISSIEPLDLSDEVLDFMISHPKICNHLHISLQGAQNELLHQMRRKYTVEYYLSRLERIKSQDPDFCIGTDVITGFPGETKEMFEEGLQNLQKFPLDYFHVFTFSSRDKTVAAKMGNHIEGPEKKVRNRILTQLSNEKKESFKQSQLNKTVYGVVERQSPAPGYVKALSTNYLPVILQGDSDKLKLKKIKMKIEEVSQDKIFASLSEEQEPGQFNE